MQHLDDGMIAELLDGEIASSELGPIAQHLAGCSECSARLEQERQMIAAADSLVLQLDEEVQTAPVARPAPVKGMALWPRNLAWAASLLVAVGVGYISGHSPKPGAARMVAAAPAESTPAASAPTAADELRQPAATVDRGETQPSIAGSTAPADRQREPETVRKQADRAPEGATASGVAKPAAKAPITIPTESVPAVAPAAEQSALGVASRKAGVAGGQRAASRDNLLADSVEAQSNGRLAALNLARPERQTAQAAATISTADSLGTPAGTLFRIEGLKLMRSEFAADQVRLIYSHPDGEVTLVQRRVGSQIEWHLVVPVGFPADTLSALLGRIK